MVGFGLPTGLARWAPLLCALAAGSWLRVSGLDAQLLAGDEVHLVRAVQELTVGEILSRYGPNDFCQPMSAFFRLWWEAGIPLDELRLRAFPLASGLLFLLLACLWAWRRLDTTTALCFTWLCAMHPLLLTYSRMLRSYMPVVLLGFAAILCVERALRVNSLRWAVCGGLLCALAVWFHLGVAPAAGAVLVATLALALRRRSAWRLGIPALCTAALAAAAFLLPARRSLGHLLDTKGGDSLPTLSGLAEVWQLHLGCAWNWLIVPLTILAIIGAASLWFRYRRLSLLVMSAVAIQITAMFVFRPEQIDHPLASSRYLLHLMPWLLLCIAEGANRVWQSRRSRFPGRMVLRSGLAAVAILYAVLNPALDSEFRASRFQLNPHLFRFTKPLPEFPEERLSEFYTGFGDQFPVGPLVLYPWYISWTDNLPHAVLERLHGQPALLMPIFDNLLEPGFQWRNFLPGMTDSAIASSARYLVVHLDPAADQAAVHPDRSFRRPGARRRRQQRELWELQAKLAYFRGKLGEPLLEDEQLAVWDLEDQR